MYKAIISTSLAATGLAGIGIGSYFLLRKRIPASPRVLPMSSITTKKVATVKRVQPAAVGAPQAGVSVLPSQYPKVRRDESVVEDLHGIQVADPYRWLEDPDSEETKQFVEAQNKLTESVLAQCDTRDQFKDLMTQLYDYPKFGTPFKKGDRYYYYHNSGLQSQYVLWTQADLASEAHVLLDPNTFSEDGTVSLRAASFSEDGKLMAYTTSSGGADWTTIKVMGISPEGKPEPLPDELHFTRYTNMTWTHDNKGFFYKRYPPPNGITDVSQLGTETVAAVNQQICYHVLGTEQSEDVVVFAMPENPTWMAGTGITDDGRYLTISVSEGCAPYNLLYVVDLQQLQQLPDGSPDFAAYEFFKGPKVLPLVKLIDEYEASYSLVANEGSTLYIMTNKDAPRYRVVKTDICSAGSSSSWPDVIPQHPKDLLQSASALKGDNLLVEWLRDVAGALELRSLTSGEVKRVFQLPGLGSIGSISCDRRYSEAFFSFSSFVDPGSCFRVDVEGEDGGQPQLFRRTELQVPHDPDDYITKREFVTSTDGTKLPVFITHKKGLQLDGARPTLLYGYGGFNVSLEPTFSVSKLAFMRGYGGVYVQANLRGGGEYGTSWRDAGSKENKQNVFDDFQAAAQYLVAQGYCSPSTLTIQGGSNGGLLVAACANQRPDLYCCVIGQVGVMDMLRFHKFTIGHAWVTDYGDPDKPEEFGYIYPYSPLHNVRQPLGGSKQYPAIYLTTGDHDDRVVPLHSFKLAATLQHELVKGEDSPQRNPLLINVDVRSGHGAGKPTWKLIAEVADSMGFAAKCMGAKWSA